MATKKQLMLVRTPEIKPDESFRGYFLRLAEANGYASQTRIFTWVNIDYPDNPSPTVESTLKIMKFLGSSTKQLLQSCNRQKDKLFFSVMGLNFHVSVFRKRSAICPDCIRDFGYIPAFTDLQPIRCCPVHRRWLIDVCPGCTKSIPWIRPGLLMCTCGAELSHQCDTAAPPSQTEIAKAGRFARNLYSGFRAGTVNGSKVKTGFSHIRFIAAITSNRRLTDIANSLTTRRQE